MSDGATAAAGQDEIRPARWFVMDGDQQQGPFDLQAMRELVLAGNLDPGEYVWADGMPDWMPAGEVPALIPPE